MQTGPTFVKVYQANSKDSYEKEKKKFVGVILTTTSFPITIKNTIKCKFNGLTASSL